MLSPDQAAELLSVSASTVRRWLRKGHLVGERYGKWWLVEEVRVLDLLAKQRPEWRSHNLTGVLLRAVAYHEAGHAVADWVMGREFTYVTVIPTARYLGCVSYTLDLPDAPWCLAQDAMIEFMARMLVDGEDVDVAEGQRLLDTYLEALGEERSLSERSLLADPVDTEKTIVMLLAGALAEKSLTGVYNERGARYDLAHALGRTLLLTEAQDTPELDLFQEIWGRASLRAAEIVSTNWLEINALARQLLTHGQLDGQAAVAVFEETRNRFAPTGGTKRPER